MASFTNPTLQNILPNAELIMLFLAVAASVLFFLLFVRSMGRKLGNKLALVETASKQIAQQDLDAPITTSVGINEFNHALQSMDDMRSILKDALIKQWESEQQRKQEIAALAHDIKTPLTVINGNAELLLEDTLEEKQAALVNSIFSAGMRVQQYVGALQQVSIIDMDNEVMERIDIVLMLGDLNAILSPLAKDKSISLEYVYSENLRPITVYPSMLARALINIVENAIRFTKTGGHITISACQNEQETLFSVQDQGPGFSKTAIHHAKEMFWQQDTSRTGSRNYGIGLSIAEKVAQKHSGQLFLENTPQGACVKFVVSSGGVGNS
ncbi:HAMP domain-containing sensor histidine kinase [Acetobacterium wieringae]|uniref:sensor histidine kinase n=1 Tax=Acetobacterium wieringae TaxID=52694 RepID=UPI002B21407D|nr:HAMP domain-containing sensor histidine kinase [Acetobacterium wieringae]MEA4804317.1 HAMP domain-containing sensor histidine kinase [Acetobacterium wieringae]